MFSPCCVLLCLSPDGCSPRSGSAGDLGDLARCALFAGQPFDVVVSNPPYLDEKRAGIPFLNGWSKCCVAASSNNLQLNSSRPLPPLEFSTMNDPHLALFANEKGLGAYRRLLHSIEECGATLLKEKGHVLLEIGHGQAAAVREVASQEAPSLQFCRMERDAQDLERMLVFERKQIVNL